MWLLIAGTALITGAYMGAFSYIAPLLTDRTGLPEWAVPVVLVCFGVGAVIGTNVAGRSADRRPFATFLIAAAGVVAVLAALLPFSTTAVPTVLLVVLLGVAGMAVPPVATGLAVRFAGHAATLAAALAVAAFNAGTAIASAIESGTLNGPLGVLAPEVVGIAMALLGIIPLAVLGARSRRVVI
jgi:DHA1 family inner membrane transport protein